MRLEESFAGLAHLRKLIAVVRNPLPLLLDRLSLQKDPYTLHARNGASLELRPAPSGDRYAFFEVFVLEDYTCGGQRLAEGDIVIDVGANVGCFALLAARKVGRSGKVFAIEPEEATFRQLTKNIGISKAANVSPQKVALGQDEGVGRLHFDGRGLFSSLYSTVDGRVLPETTQEIRVTTLRMFMRATRIERCHYLKLDCEGAEHEIIASLDPETAARIDQITIEIHGLPGKPHYQLHKAIEKLGFELISTEGQRYYRRR